MSADRIRRAAFDDAINAVIGLQISDAGRLAEAGTGHGWWCQHGTADTCHGAEADATHERVLASLRKLRDEASDRSRGVASDASPAAGPVQARTGLAAPGEGR